MAYNEKLADRLREALIDVARVEEKKMFRGITFMVDEKMCVCVSGDELMCRIDPALHDALLEKRGCRPMIMKGKDLSGYVLVSEEGLRSKKDLDYWVGLCLVFNKEARASKKKGRRS